MKAVMFRQHGGPEVLEYADVPDPSIGAGEILVRVNACSVNHLDLWIRQGIPAYHVSLPHISGADVAGVVERVGPDVTRPQVGDRVVLMPSVMCGACEWCRVGQDNLCESYRIRGAGTDGGYAELVSAHAQDAYPISPDGSFEEAAAFPLVFLTAWHMLVTRAKLQENQTVLIQAGGSGVGHAAIQIAKYLKARVIATVGSDEKIPKAKALGADEVINYRREDFYQRVKALTQDRGVDVVFEHIGPETWEKSVRLLAKNGRLVTCGATSGPTVSLDLRYMFSRQLSILGSIMGTRAEFQLVTQLIGAGTFKPVVDTVFPLREARAAQERMMNRDVFGKLVLRPT